MSLPDILRDIDLKAVDGVAEDKENAASEAPIVEKVTMRPHSMPLVSLFFLFLFFFKYKNRNKNSVYVADTV